MPIYLAIPLIPESTALDAAVANHIPEKNRFKLQADRGWLIKFEGTTVELSNALTVTGHEKGEHSLVGSTLITPVSNYYGIGPADMWEWLKTRIEQ